MLKQTYINSLTQREIETAALLAQGESRKAIARAQHISLNTVASRVDSILFKTHSRKSVEAVSKLIRRGIIGLFIGLLILPTAEIDKSRRHTRRQVRPVYTMQVH